MKKIIITLIIIMAGFTLMFAQNNVTITNVSINPNPFSPNNDGQRDNVYINYYLYFPTTLANPQVELTFYRNSNVSNVVKQVTLTPVNGLNQYMWDGKDAGGAVVADGNYGLQIKFNNPQKIYKLDQGIIVKTTYPVIEIVSASPNPFSPNGDGYQDVQTVRPIVKNADTHYLGTIRINFADSTAWFVDDDLITPVTPNPIPYSDGAYLFLSRPSELWSAMNIPANLNYNISVNGFSTTITSGMSLYKLGENYLRSYGSIGSGVGIEIDEFYGNSIDYLAVYAMPGNMSFNAYNADGSDMSLNDMYHFYYGSFTDNPANRKLIDSSIGRDYPVNLGKEEGQVPGTDIEDGRYLYRIIVSNEVETGIFLSGEFIVNNNPINLSGEINPNRISPQIVDGVFDKSIIQYSPTEDAYITVKVWDQNNQLVKTIIQNQLNLKGVGNYMLWDGKNEAGQVVSQNSESWYRIEITAVDRYVNDDVASLSIDLLVDNKAPDAASLSQTSPVNLNSPNLVISGLSNEISCDIILVQNGVDKGVVGQTPQYPGYFEFNVSLEEGNNNISVKLRDSVYNLGTTSNQVTYYLDSQAPVISSILPTANTVFTELPVEFSAQVTDNGLGVNHVRFGFSLNNSSNLIWKNGVKEPGTDIYKCQLTSSEIGDNVSQVAFTMVVSATDNMNNTIQTTNPLSYNYFRPSATNPPVLNSSYPSNNSNIRQIENNRIQIVINSENPLRLDVDSTYIALVNKTSNDTLSHNHGAVLSYSQNGNAYSIVLTLSNPLNTNGADDSDYEIYYRVVNQVYQDIEGYIYFNYDTTSPQIANLKLNANPILIAGDRNYFTSNVNTVQMILSDNLSGIDYAMNMSQILLYDSEGNAINGSRSYNEIQKTITWTLTNPIQISSPTDYTIATKVSDKAGNSRIQNYVFTLLTPQAPVIMTDLPANNTIIKTLANNKISKTLTDTNGFGLNITNTSLVLSKGGTIYSHGNNAVQTLIQNSNGTYELSLTLTDPLATDGSADSVYTVTTNVRDLLNQTITSQTTFKYDTQAPVFSTPKIGNTANSWVDNLTNGITYNQRVKYISIDVSDITSGLNITSNNTFIKMYKANGSLLTGSLNYSAGKLIWTLDSDIPQELSQNGAYYVLYSAVDNAQNTTNGRIDFNLQDYSFEPNPVFSASYPVESAKINTLTGNQVKVVVQSAYPVNQNILDSYIKLYYLPNINSDEVSQTYEHGQGALLSYQVQGTQTTMVLTLLQPLSTDGAHDGRYRVEYYVKTSLNQTLTNTFEYIYDTTAPQITALNVNNTSELQNAGDRKYFTSAVNTVSVTLSDVFAGVNFAMNMSKIFLYDESNNIISGVRSFDPVANKLIWTLDTPLTVAISPANYRIFVEVRDNTNANVRSLNSTFTLLTPQAPGIVTHVPANNAIMKTLINNKISKIITDTNSFGLDTENTNITLSKDGTIYSNGNNAVQTLTQNSNGTYELSLSLTDPLATDGSVDGIYTVTTNVTDLLGQTIVNNQTTFVYDTKVPVFENATISGTHPLNGNWEQTLANDIVYNNYVNKVKIKVNDLGSQVNVNSTSTYIKLFKSNNQIIEGVMNYQPSDSTLIWTLNSSIPANNSENGDYYVIFNAIDMAGNSSNGRIDFSIQNTDFASSPLLISTYPTLNQNVNQLNSNQIKAVIQSEFPINQEVSYVKLTHSVTGVCIENNQGALLSFQTQGNQTTMTLTLNQGLQTDGADDAPYYVEYYAKNSLNQLVTGSVLFNYDTSRPNIASLKINQSALQTVNQINYYTNRIDSVSVYLNDNLSGINFAANMSRIQLYNQSDQIINGLRSIDVNTRRITWKLNNPILLDDSNIGLYTIKVIAYDNANNSNNQNIVFQLINPSQPLIVEHIPTIDAVINQLVNNRISKKVLDVNTFGLDRVNTQIILQGPLATYQNTNGASLSFSSLQNNLHQVNLTLTNPLATNGSADGNYTVQTTIVDTIGQSVVNQMNFIYDTQTPVVSNELIGGTQGTTPWSSNLSNNMIINKNIQYVSINLNDVTTQVNYSSSGTYVGIYNAQNQLLQGTQSLNGNTLKYILDNQLLSDGSMDGTYYAKYSATDIAGNTITGQKYFRLINPSAPQINNIVPAHESVFNMLANNEIYVEFTDIRPIDLQDYENSYIKVTTPNNTVIEHNQGATQQIISTGENTYKMNLILNQELSLNGLYTLQIKVQNTQSYSTQFPTQFVFDNQAPQIQSVRLGLQNGTEAIVTNNDNIYHGVSYVKLFLSDLIAVPNTNPDVNITAGINYTSNNTQISVSINNQTIPGTLTNNPDENYLKYVFSEPLTELGSIVSLQYSAEDYADNRVNRQLSFILNALEANIVSITPGDNAFINTNLNQIKLVVEYDQNVVMNENLTYLRLKHPDGSFIEDGQGAVLEISSNENQYEITLNLNQPLGSNGQDDGQYQIFALLATDNFQEGPITFNFVYDRLAPYYQNLKINDMIVNSKAKFIKEQSVKLNNRNELIFSQPITHIQVNYLDLTSQVNFASNLTSISLLNPNGALVQGTRIIDNGTVKWVLSSPIPVDGTKDGSYTIQMKATDFAGNMFNANYTFTLMSHIIPQLLSYTPQDVINYYTNSFSPPTITGSFKNTIPVVQNPLNTYIKLIFPNGEIAQHSQGANLSYQLEQNNLKATLQLTGPLSTNGENDGQFLVNFHATNYYGAEFDTTMTFIYDTITPSYSELALFNGSTQNSVSSNSIVSQAFNAVQVKFSDMTSGVHYSPNISYISLYDFNNNLIPGTLSYIDSGSEKISRWTFLNSDAVPFNGTADGIYKIKMMITDKAGNSVTKEVPFNVISIIAPQNLVTYLDAVYKVHISWNNPNPGKKQILSRTVSYYQVFRKYNDQDFVQIAQTSNLYYSDNLQQQNDGTYTYMVKAVYSVPGQTQLFVSEGSVSNQVQLKRFTPCTFNVSLSDGQAASGILFHLLGNDGIYNQEVNISTDQTGVINLPAVYMTDYILTLSKEGYQTIVDTITVDLVSNVFNYSLLANAPSQMVQPPNYALYQNFPNPFNPTTEIRFALKDNSQVDLAIFNIKGQRIKQLIDHSMDYGYHKAVWNGVDSNGKRVGSGIYFYILNVKSDKENYREIKKMIMVK